MNWLRAEDRDGVEAFLRARGWIAANTCVAGVSRAGEGNMNLVLRVELDGAADASVILKQSRPWVEKYPRIAAPAERISVEVDFYRLAASDPGLAAHLPRLIAADTEHHAALFADLGPARDYTALYAGAALTDADAAVLLAWLSRLHHQQVEANAWPRMANRAMRALNRTHIFDLPLAADGAPDADGFCPGLGRIAAEFRRDEALGRRLRVLAAEYESDGPILVHGDFYPGSWLMGGDGPMVIDPEFGFLGRAEFDLGVFIAHLHFSGSDLALLGHYRPPPHFDRDLAEAFAGAELIRRVLGVAQLPIRADLAARESWLRIGRDKVLA